MCARWRGPSDCLDPAATGALKTLVSDRLPGVVQSGICRYLFACCELAQVQHFPRRRAARWSDVGTVLVEEVPTEPNTFGRFLTSVKDFEAPVVIVHPSGARPAPSAPPPPGMLTPRNAGAPLASSCTVAVTRGGARTFDCPAMLKGLVLSDQHDTHSCGRSVPVGVAPSGGRPPFARFEARLPCGSAADRSPLRAHRRGVGLLHSPRPLRP